MSASGSELPSRVIIEGVSPQLEGGRFPVKRCVGDRIAVEADIHCDGHDVLAGVVKWRLPSREDWNESALSPLPNDRWRGELEAVEPGTCEFALEAWIDTFATWRRDLQRRVDAGQSVQSELLEGIALIRHTAERSRADAAWLVDRASGIERAGDERHGVTRATDPALAEIMARNADRSRGQQAGPFPIIVERERARYGAWYEVFPRSTADQPGRHGTFRDLERRLPYIAGMAFDVLYLPPIHPIGQSYRKGPNNSLEAGSTDPGSPWAIGGKEGGHTAIHPELGTFDDFERLVTRAAELGLEIALDIAFQCSPDHPWVREHPEWFRHRPDGTIKYAENPPKKYQDIYPLDFECPQWRDLWAALRDVVLFWNARGVRIFRVDNPHTKPFRFWEWLIREVRAKDPNVIFLSEAFTRPKVMRYLAKSGFSQSYTYFTWRNTKRELTDYFTELTQGEARETMRPNLFVTTPDILPEYLQHGGPAAFRTRLVLAATLGATYGLYGPGFEVFENQPVKPHSEEFLDSEKYQIRNWAWDRPSVFSEFIGLVNRFRRENPALHRNESLRFCRTDNEQLLCYGKSTTDGQNVIVCVVNLDPHHVQSGWVTLPIHEWQVQPGETYQLHDLLTNAHFLWQGETNFVQLDPQKVNAHVLRLRKRVRTERDFDYYF